MSALHVRNISVNFGGIAALSDVSFDVHANRICALIGPNGAGKTTLFNVVSGIYLPSAGQISYGAVDLTALRRDEVVRHGVARTFQNVALCPTMSVIDNLMLGAHARNRQGIFSVALCTSAKRREAQEQQAEAMLLLERIGLADAAYAHPTDLPFGSQKKVELMRALMAHPKLLLLDEPANGLSHGEVSELASMLMALRDEFNLTVVLVEHHMEMVFKVAENIVVLDAGRVLATGTPNEIRGDPRVVEAYLGKAN